MGRVVAAAVVAVPGHDVGMVPFGEGADRVGIALELGQAKRDGRRPGAVGMAHGPQAGLALLAPLEADSRLSGHHRLHAVRAHLLEMAGDHESARGSYQTAARLTTSVPEQNYLQDCAMRLAQGPRSGAPRPQRDPARRFFS